MSEEIQRRTMEQSGGSLSGGLDMEERPPAPVTVISGTYRAELPAAGMAVAQIRQRFQDRLDIEDQSRALIDGNPVAEDIVLRSGQILMFVRRAGEKGAGGEIHPGLKATPMFGGSNFMPRPAVGDED